MFNHLIINALGGDNIVELSSKELTKDEIAGILLSESPMLELEAIVSNYSENEISETEDYIFQEIASENNLDEYDLDILMKEISESVEFKVSMRDYLDTKVCVNLMIDTGDSNRNFMLNSVHLPVVNGNEEPFNEKASILYLVRQQGYTDEQLYSLLNKEKLTDIEYNTFLGSIYSELENLGTDIAPLVFLVSMNLGDLINLNDSIKNKTIKSVIIDKSVNCGLYNYVHGCGSILEITLDKDFEIPIEHIMSPIMIDGGNGYPIEDTYGVYPTLWKDVLKFR